MRQKGLDMTQPALLRIFCSNHHCQYFSGRMRCSFLSNIPLPKQCWRQNAPSNEPGGSTSHTITQNPALKEAELTSLQVLGHFWALRASTATLPGKSLGAKMEMNYDELSFQMDQMVCIFWLCKSSLYRLLTWRRSCRLCRSRRTQASAVDTFWSDLFVTSPAICWNNAWFQLKRKHNQSISKLCSRTIWTQRCFKSPSMVFGAPTTFVLQPFAFPALKANELRTEINEGEWCLHALVIYVFQSTTISSLEVFSQNCTICVGVLGGFRVKDGLLEDRTGKPVLSKFHNDIYNPMVLHAAWS